MESGIGYLNCKARWESKRWTLQRKGGSVEAIASLLLSLLLSTQCLKHQANLKSPEWDTQRQQTKKCFHEKGVPPTPNSVRPHHHRACFGPKRSANYRNWHPSHLPRTPSKETCPGISSGKAAPHLACGIFVFSHDQSYIPPRPCTMISYATM